MFGAWDGNVDVDRLKADLEASRHIPPRPAPELLTYLVDTDTSIDYLKGAPKLPKFAGSLATEDLGISLMTYGEVYEGIYYGRDPLAAERAFRQLLRTVSVVPHAQRPAAVRPDTGRLRHQGQLVGDPDILVPATALRQGLLW